MKKSLKTLAKQLDFNSEEDYFNYMADSYINGNFSQCKDLFNAMSKEDRKEALKWLKLNINYQVGEIDGLIYNYYFNLL